MCGENGSLELDEYSIEKGEVAPTDARSIGRTHTLILRLVGRDEFGGHTAQPTNYNLIIESLSRH